MKVKIWAKNNATVVLPRKKNWGDGKMQNDINKLYVLSRKLLLWYDDHKTEEMADHVNWRVYLMKSLFSRKEVIDDLYDNFSNFFTKKIVQQD